MYLQGGELQRYAAAIADKVGLRVEYNDQLGYSTDGRTIYMRHLPHDAERIDHEVQHQTVNHEVSHVLYSDFDVLKNIENHPNAQVLHALWNGIEDPRVDFLNSREYAGDRLLQERVYEHKLKQLLSKWKAHADTGAQLNPAMAFSIWVLNEANATFLPAAEWVGRDIEALLPEQCMQWIERYAATDIHEDIVKAMCEADPSAGTRATHACAERIMREVMDMDAPKMGNPEQKQKQSEGENGDKPERKNSSENSGGQNKGKSQEKGKALKNGSADKNEEMDTVLYTPGDGVPHLERDKPRGHHVDYSNWSSRRDYVPATQGEYRIVDYTRGVPPRHNIDTQDGVALNDVNTSLHFQYDLEAERAFDALIAEGAGKALANRLRTKLQIRSRSEINWNQRKGKLDGSRLYKVPMRVKGYSDRVFTQKVEKDTLDTVVFWLGDMSGSMSGEKYAHLMLATVRMNEAVGNVLGIPLEIAFFTDLWTTSECLPVQVLLRTASERHVGQDRLAASMKHASVLQASNPDGDALVWAYQRIIRHPAKRKVLIVASDGSPATGRAGDGATYLMEVCKQIQDEKNVELYGLGIMDRNVEMFYRNHKVVEHAHELEGALLGLLDKAIR